MGGTGSYPIENLMTTLVIGYAVKELLGNVLATFYITSIFFPAQHLLHSKLLPSHSEIIVIVSTEE